MNFCCATGESQQPDIVGTESCKRVPGELNSSFDVVKLKLK